jgi:hypothetical protein
MMNITNRAARIIGPIPAITPTITTIPGMNVAAGIIGAMIGMMAGTIAAGIGDSEGVVGAINALTVPKLFSCCRAAD